MLVHIKPFSIRRHQILGVGVLGRKWKSPRKFFWRSSGIPEFFAFGGLFSLWRHWKPLKPLKNRYFFDIFQKPSNFWKKGPHKFFACRRLFSKKSSVDFTKVVGQSEGVQKHTWTPPPLTGYAIFRKLRILY